ncbi:MAG: tetratricopeptide repeat protein, partial [Promethearchaeota archaeon]
MTEPGRPKMYEPYEGDLKSLLGGEEALTFLVGAGISMEPPAGLMSAGQMMEAIIRYSAVEAAVPQLLAIPELRFEYLIEAFRDRYDEDLQVLNYLEEATQPNVIHQFLAQMVQRGHFVMTTNFDTLIERAVGLEQKNLRIVITQTDFEQYADPKANWEKGLWAVYKLHGSLTNVQTGENTHSSVIATLDALGKHKEGELGVETFKKPLFKRVGQGRTLVVMGYSGGDDLDIIPTLLQMSGLRRVVWLSHTLHSNTTDSGPGYQVFRYTGTKSAVPPQLSPEDQLLSRMHQISGVEVIKVVGHTATILAALQGRVYQPSPSSERHDLAVWLVEHFTPASEDSKIIFAINIFYRYNRYPDALKYCAQAHTLSTQHDDLHGQAVALNYMGLVYRLTSEPQKALEHFQKSYEIHEHLGNWAGMAAQLGNMGLIYANTGEPQKALEHHQKR